MSDSLSLLTGHPELEALRTRVRARVDDYLRGRADEAEQRDHLGHIARRLAWIYDREAPPGLDERDRLLADIAVLAHDVGKWVPRETLRALFDPDPARLAPHLDRLHLSVHQRDLFMLGVRRRLALPQDTYLTEYDSIHHLVSAFLLSADPALGFAEIAAADQARLILIVVGHQFGGYFKENLLALSLGDEAIHTGMLVDVSRPDRLAGDLLARAFHDADIADLLFVGSLRKGEDGAEHFHAGGLLKILIVNLGNYVRRTPHAPKSMDACFRMAERTVRYAADELLTPTARGQAVRWQMEARGFVRYLQEPDMLRAIRREIASRNRTREACLAAVRARLYREAEGYVRRSLEVGGPRRTGDR